MDHTTTGDDRKWFEKSQAALPKLAGKPACAYAVFYCLLGHVTPGTNTWAMSYTELASETGLSRRGIMRGIANLRQIGLITTNQQKRERTVFTLHIPQLVTETTPVNGAAGDSFGTNTGDRS